MVTDKLAVTKFSPPKGTPLLEAERAELMRHVRESGERVVLAALGIHGQTLGRALGGLTIHRGSVALIHQGLAKLEAADQRARDAEQIAGTGGRP